MNEFEAAEIRAELEAHGTMRPPWLRFPELERGSIGWRMGSGEQYAGSWAVWFEGLADEARRDYFKRLTPVPAEWLDWVVDALLGPLTYEESDEEMARYVTRLERMGIVGR